MSISATRVACVMMQRNENLLLEAWIRYHADLFGLSNLSVFDNGSTRTDVHAILDRYEAQGLFVDRAHPTQQDFFDKGEIVGTRMRTLRDTGSYDFLFPLDCDEFVALRTETSFIAAPAAIHAYLATLRGRPETLKIQSEFLNTLACPGYYRLIACNKTFYAAQAFDRTDHGFHTAGARGNDDFFLTDIAHVHYHNKPFRRLRADARRKLAGLGVDVADREALRDLPHSRHLVPYLLCTEAELTARAAPMPHIYQPDFIRRMALLGATDSALLARCFDGQPVPPTLLPPQFSRAAYWQANPDVAAANTDAFLHYSIFGYAEQRRIAP